MNSNRRNYFPAAALALSGAFLLVGCTQLGLAKVEEDNTLLLAAAAYVATQDDDNSSTPTPNGSCQLAGAGAKCESWYNNSQDNTTLNTACVTNLGGTYTAGGNCTSTSLLGTCKFATKTVANGGPGGDGTTISYIYSGNAENFCTTNEGGTFSTAIQYP